MVAMVPLPRLHRLLQRLQRLRRLAAVAVFSGASAIAGCTAVVAPNVGGYSTVYADNVPPDIYAYPRVWFSGGYAYMVGDSWYYPNGGRWLRLRGEPPELHRYRAEYGRAPYGGGRVVREPPAMRPAGRSAPASPVSPVVPGPRAAPLTR
jgi:hypothetical protein